MTMRRFLYFVAGLILFCVFVSGQIQHPGLKSIGNVNISQISGTNVAGCTGSAPTIINLSTSGNTLLLAGSAMKNIYICDMEFSTGAPEDFKLTEGTGANCVTGTADSTGLNKSITSWSLSPGGGLFASRITQTAGDSLCANQANTQAGGVTLWTVIQ